MRIFVPTLLALAALAAMPARAEDLLEVYAQARAADPRLAQAVASRGIQQELAVQARAGLLPSWSASWGSSRGEPGNAESRGLRSSLSQVLFDLSQWKRLDAAQAESQAEDLRLKSAEQQLCARVAIAYFGVLTAQASLATAEANENAFATQVSQAQTRFETGLSAQIDVEQARTYHALARGTTVQARQNLLDAREALAEITGKAPGELRPLQAQLDALPPQPADPAAWVEQALQANPSLKAGQFQLQGSEARVEAARSAHLPTLSVGLDSQRLTGNAIAPQDMGRTQHQIALRLSIPLFAGGATESSKRQAYYQRDNQREQLEVARRALVRETQAQYQAVLAGIELVRSTSAAVAASDRALAATRAGQQLGTRTMTDLLLVLQTQAQAQMAQAQARHRYVLATLLLRQAAGALGESELAAVNALLQPANTGAAKS
ncbi:TolC family outer membrane protein [Pelomonas sp. SE-A7]|uniref:TolC family outer membrane protein n=1 Tax=Pelomonas sp. SE-A7 TaxID=3054953 RepID=UPI00259CA264|nr:TolC family outer membrane protein [Pelomonas sp. SE-A7]MDM4768029.1 TolC family outer membrane protein [Pelomonas sp. SE-A7]